MSTPSSDPSSDLVVVDVQERVATLTMNMPRRLNGWTLEMMAATKAALARVAVDDAVAAVVLTGTGKYYSAGVNLASTIKLAHPRDLHALIVQHNQALFDSFINFPKPILIAVNGPTIGAAVTSATLCDGIIASDRATFSTPFAALGVTPEGCSSVLFAKLMGEENAQRMLGPEGYKPTGTEAEAMGLVQWVVDHDSLMAEAQRIAEGWVQAGHTRSFRGEMSREELAAINAEESLTLATAFLGRPFLRGQYEFLKRKGKRGPAAMFYGLWLTQPLWSRLR